MKLKRISSTGKKFAIGILIVIVAILWSLPSILEYYIDRNDIKWIGRETLIDDIDLNVFTGLIIIHNGQIFEKNGREVFIEFSSLEVNLRMISLLSSRIEAEYIHLTAPRARIVQNKTGFNFDDLFQSEDPPDKSGSESMDYILHNISLENGLIEYIDQQLSANFGINQLNIDIPEVNSSIPGLEFNLNASQKEGGDLDLHGYVNWDKEEYGGFAQVTDWQIKPYQNYLDTYLAIQEFSGLYNLEILLDGSFGDDSKISARATSSLNDFLLVDNNADSLLSWKRLQLVVDSVHTSEGIYNFGAALLDQPKILLKYYKEGDSFSGLLIDSLNQQSLDTVSVSANEIVFQNPFQYITEYIYYLLDDEVLTTYGADSMFIHDGTVEFIDYAHLEESKMLLTKIDVHIPKVEHEDSVISFLMNSDVNNSGKLNADLKILRSGFSDFGLNLNLSEVYISSFDPYSRYYTAHPLWEGVMTLNSHSTIRRSRLESKNDLTIRQVNVGKKTDMKAEYNVPLRFAIGLLKDVNGDIVLEVPVEGDLNDPDYKLGKVILKVIMNLFAKAAASPYKLLARAFDADEDDLKAIRFENDQDSLANQQRKAMDLTARILKNKTDLNISLNYVFNARAEKQVLALKRAKKLFVDQLPDSVGAMDWAKVDSKDSVFVLFLNEKVGGLGQRTVTEMCVELVGEDLLDARIAELKSKQCALVGDYLYRDMGIDSTRAPIIEKRDEKIVSAYQKPLFMIDYKVSPGDSTSVSSPEDALRTDTTSVQTY